MVEILVNDTIVNATQVINDNMPVQPEKFIIIVGIFFVLSLVIGIGAIIWTKMK